MARKLKTKEEGDEVVAQALRVLQRRVRAKGECLREPSVARDIIRIRLGTETREVFAALWLDNQHRLIEVRTEAVGTINEASVYPREIVKSAIELNAAAVIFAHNHPSGVAEPSWADRALTRRLKDALALLDIRVLDHFVVGGEPDFPVVSFSERGWL